MQAVVKSTSNGEPSSRQSRAELCSNAEERVETCAESYRVVARIKHSTDTGEEPALLNGGCGARAHQGSIESQRYSPNLQATGEPKAAIARRFVGSRLSDHERNFISWLTPHFQSAFFIDSPSFRSRARSVASDGICAGASAALKSPWPNQTSSEELPSHAGAFARIEWRTLSEHTASRGPARPSRTKRGARCMSASRSPDIRRSVFRCATNGRRTNRFATTSTQTWVSDRRVILSIESTTLAGISPATCAGLQRPPSRAIDRATCSSPSTENLSASANGQNDSELILRPSANDSSVAGHRSALSPFLSSPNESVDVTLAYHERIS